MANKKVLFIGIGFYDYEESIIKEFKKLDYEVDYFCEVPPNNLINRFYSRMKNKNKFKEINTLHVVEIANRCGTYYDLVFVIKCENMTIDCLEIIKNKNPKAKFILYLWDSVERISNIESKFEYFDKIFSFDRLDCVANENLIFNPLFFRDEYINNSKVEKPEFDIYHLGWYHSDRLALIKKVNAYCELNNLKSKMILFAGYFSYLIQSLFGGELKGNRKFLVFKSISAKFNRQFIIESRVILDIAHPNQSGLTIRTIELLGMQKKMITTNSDIVNYDFYHSNNILVIDREACGFNKDFFEIAYLPISKEVVSKYSITNWLKRMIV